MKESMLKIIKLVPIIIIMSLLLLIVFVGDAQVAAFNVDDYKPSSTTEATGADKVLTIGNSIIGVLQVIGTIVSVAVLGVMGIKYMLGSVEERADYKTSMIPYVAGAILLFGITNILAFIIRIANELF